MYRIEQTDFGLRLRFLGYCSLQDILNWLKESENLLDQLRKPFGVLVDMRTYIGSAPEAQQYIYCGQQLYRQKGMDRSAVVLDSSEMVRHFQEMARLTGIAATERYFNAAREDWEQKAQDWIRYGYEPEHQFD